MLYRIARYYYEDNLSQDEIAQREHVSRPHVSRLLEKARECGIVNISVSLPEELQASKTRRMLKDKLGLNEVVVVIVPAEVRNMDKKASINIATAAAKHIPDWIKDCRNVGIGWGFTMYQTSLQLTYCSKCNDLTVVPLIGISGDNNPYLQINAIVDRFAEKFGADSYYTNLPAMRDKNTELARIDRERYARLQHYWDGLDAAIVGLGASPKGEEFFVSEVSREYKKTIANSNTLGDILCQFFYGDGRIFDFQSQYEQMSFPIYKLKDIKKVICLAGGQAKVDGIIAAAQSGFINVLVTDSVTAGSILDKLER